MTRRKQRIALQWTPINGRMCAVAADDLSRQRLRDKGYRAGDVVFAEMVKPRNPRFHRLIHAFGKLVAENIDSFHGLDAHAALKRIQWEAGIGCDEMGVRVGGQMVAVRIPQSLSYESMDEGEFREVARGMCRHVSETYWPECTEDEIAHMPELSVQEVA